MEIEGKIISIIGDNLPSKISMGKEVYVFDSIPKYTRNKKIIEALKMVNLEEDYLLKKSNDLSNTEYNKLMLAKDLIIGSKVIYLDYFEKGMCFKEKEYFKKLLKKITKNYGITFIVKTNDFSFCLNFVDEFHLFENNLLSKVVDKKDIYKEKIYKYYNTHQLIDFVVKSRKLKHMQEDYFDIKEIMKAVYRELK